MLRQKHTSPQDHLCPVSLLLDVTKLGKLLHRWRKDAVDDRPHRRAYGLGEWLDRG